MTGTAPRVESVRLGSSVAAAVLTRVGTGWYNCETRIYRFDMSTDSNVVDAAIVETDESRLKRTLTLHSFSQDQQLEMKREAEASWATDGYIILADTKQHPTAQEGFEPEVRRGERTLSKLSTKVIRGFRPNCCIL